MHLWGHAEGHSAQPRAVLELPCTVPGGAFPPQLGPFFDGAFFSPLQADLVRADRILPILSLAASRDPSAAPSAQCPAAEITQAADLRRHRSADICQSLRLSAEGAERLGDREAGNRNPVAPRGLSFVLAMEVKIARWSSEAALRH